jgi:nitrite reductase/ring-hydroxylating ferredoxin subunit
MIPIERPDSGSIGRVKVAETNEITEGRSKIVNVAGKTVAVFRVKDQYFAISNNCLHRGGPLGEGEVRNYEITCPWHGWKYNLLDGAFSLIPTLKVKTYPVKEGPEGIYIEL